MVKNNPNYWLNNEKQEKRLNKLKIKVIITDTQEGWKITDSGKIALL